MPSTWLVVIWYQCWWSYSFSSSCHFCHFGMLYPTWELVSCTQWQDKLPVNLGGNVNHTSVLVQLPSLSHCCNFACLHLHSRGCSQQKCPPPSAYSGSEMSLTVQSCELHLFVPYFWNSPHNTSEWSCIWQTPLFHGFKLPFFSKIPRL